MFSEFGKCRCCIHPSTSVVKLTTLTKIAGLKDKTYNEILQEITNSTNVRNKEPIN